MSESGQAWGMCAAYGCPLLGTMGGDKWYCFCHANRPNGSNDDITNVLRSDAAWAIVQATLDIRRHFGSFVDAPDAYRRIQQRLIEADRRDLLLGKADESPNKPGKPIVRTWLARLESELVKLTASAGRQQGPSGIVKTGTVIGPTHIGGYMPDTEHRDEESGVEA
ncbi:hypothetical protein [Burkholderia vietnamiensis]|uniref:hypothetical protein n=1 Tax=Burkholderia vietnamiensis TaxID=60552 RepID=UPI001B97776D|nr:hypothetical protein [Burkholderia vietnamiensis]MBR8147053.1 hypothetical protein [Burkholderia vietnamiensis]